MIRGGKYSNVSSPQEKRLVFLNVAAQEGQSNCLRKTNIDRSVTEEENVMRFEPPLLLF